MEARKNALEELARARKEDKSPVCPFREKEECRSGFMDRCNSEGDSIAVSSEHARYICEKEMHNYCPRYLFATRKE